MRAILTLTLTILATASVCGPSRAQDQPSTTGDMGELRQEVASLSRSLERVSDALIALVKLQKTSVLLQQVVVEEQRLAPLGGELRSARQAARSQGEEVNRLKAFQAELEERIATALRTGMDPKTEAGAREEAAQVEIMLQLATEQMDASLRRIQELESDLGRARRALDILDEKLAQALEEIGQ